MMLNNIKLIIFDFDGVICDSVDVKTKAFIELYKNHGEKVKKQVRDYHLKNGGISRYEKLKYFEFVLLKKSFSDINYLANRFADLVIEKVISAPFIKGAYEFISREDSITKQYICTGTPQAEIIQILKSKGIYSFFTEVYGSPTSKVDIINKILLDTKVDKKHCLFIGDAISDYNAAKECGIPFIGIKNEETVFPLDTTLVENFIDFKLKN